MPPCWPTGASTTAWRAWSGSRRTVVEALADRVAVLKPQSAFFERFGSRGVAVLERAVEQARAAGALVVMDAKRGDIGSTMAAYAETFLATDARCSRTL